MTTKTGPDVLRKLADHYRDVIGWGAADSFKVLAGDWEAERAALNSETNRADAAELRANVLAKRDETETMNIGAALFAVVLRDDTGAGEMPAGPCADVLAEWRRLRQAEAALERARALAETWAEASKHASPNSKVIMRAFADGLAAALAAASGGAA